MSQVPMMDADLATIDISMPLLADGKYELIIKVAALQPTNKGGQMIKLELETTAPANSRTGTIVNAGCKVFDQINLVPSGKATPELIMQKVGALVQAAQFPPGIAKMTNIPQWVPSLVGKTVGASVGFENARSDATTGKRFREKNVVDYYFKKLA